MPTLGSKRMEMEAKYTEQLQYMLLHMEFRKKNLNGTTATASATLAGRENSAH